VVELVCGRKIASFSKCHATSESDSKRDYN